MTYFFARVIITDILVVYRKKISSKKEALVWNTRTGICMNFELVAQKQINDWEGEVIWIPQQGERK